MNKIIKERISIKGIATNYYIVGTGQKQVLLLHGWASSFENWKNFLSKIDGQNFKWIFVELPGFGESEGVNNPLTVSDYLEFCQAFLAKTNLNPTYLMAHSFGARISIKWLNGISPFQKVVFAGAAGIKSPLPKFKQYLKKISPFINKYLKFPNKCKKYFYRLISSPDYFELSDVMKKTFANVIDEDLTPLLPNIKVPVQLVWGAGDTYTPLWMAKMMESQIPNSKLYIFEDARHGLHHQKAAELVKIVEDFYNS